MNRVILIISMGLLLISSSAQVEKDSATVYLSSIFSKIHAIDSVCQDTAKWDSFNRYSFCKDGVYYETEFVDVPSLSDGVIDAESINNFQLHVDLGLVQFNSGKWRLKNYNNSTYKFEGNVSQVVKVNESLQYYATEIGLLELKDSVYTLFNTSNSPLGLNRVDGISLASDSSLYVANNSKLLNLKGDVWQEWNSTNSNLPEYGIKSVYSAGSGDLFVCGHASFYLLEDSIFIEYNQDSGLATNAYLEGFAEGVDDTVYIYGNGYSYKLKDKILEEFKYEGSFLRSLYAGIEGTVFAFPDINFGRSFLKFNGQQWSKITSLNPNASVSSIDQDSSGHIFVLHDDTLSIIKEDTIVQQYSGYSLMGKYFRNSYQDVQDGRIVRYRNGEKKMDNFDTSVLGSLGYVTNEGIDEFGGLWYSTTDWIVRDLGDSAIVISRDLDSLLDGGILNVDADENGSLYILTSLGLLENKTGEWRTHSKEQMKVVLNTYGSTSGTSAYEHSVFFDDQDSAVMFLLTGFSHVTRFDGNSWKNFDFEEASFSNSYFIDQDCNGDIVAIPKISTGENVYYRISDTMLIQDTFEFSYSGFKYLNTMVCHDGRLLLGLSDGLYEILNDTLKPIEGISIKNVENIGISDSGQLVGICSMISSHEGVTQNNGYNCFFSYNWGKPVINEWNREYAVTDSLLDSLSIIDSNSMDSTFQDSVAVLIEDFGLGGYNVYPTAFNQVLIINSPNGHSSFSLYGIDGKLYMKMSLEKGKIFVDVNDLPSASYVGMFDDGKKVTSSFHLMKE